MLSGNTMKSALCKEMATNRSLFISIISKSKFGEMLTQYVILWGGVVICGVSVAGGTTTITTAESNF